MKMKMAVWLINIYLIYTISNNKKFKLNEY